MITQFGHSDIWQFLSQIQYYPVTSRVVYYNAPTLGHRNLEVRTILRILRTITDLLLQLKGKSFRASGFNVLFRSLTWKISVQHHLSSLELSSINSSLRCQR
ncbi:hypothetical protein CEXT_228411 [Caerostris extrusa]|uniref:Uncharacterized protein n=1 Tax=Caerostris extrusa TaxID=172846 RepID=A0AAV4QDA4_CAEEX|nr:hypothetical protein CEXT_228411 [Caerostris extrusa]